MGVKSHVAGTVQDQHCIIVADWRGHPDQHAQPGISDPAPGV